MFPFWTITGKDTAICFKTSIWRALIVTSVNRNGPMSIDTSTLFSGIFSLSIRPLNSTELSNWFF